MTQDNNSINQNITLFIGIDWADRRHDCHLIDGEATAMQLDQSPEAIELWVGEMTQLAGGGKIAIMLEQSKGALIHALMFRENILLYPVNPTQLARYRESYTATGGKSDVTDAR